MTDNLFQGDVLSAAEYNGRHRTQVADEPLLRLMVALFDVAWADASYRGNSRAWSQRRDEALDWFVNPNSGEGPFSFQNICELLGYDVHAAREKICEKLESRQRRRLMRRPQSRTYTKLIACHGRASSASNCSTENIDHICLPVEKRSMMPPSHHQCSVPSS